MLHPVRFSDYFIAALIGSLPLLQPDDTSSGGVEEVQMSSVGLDPETPTGAVDPIANLTKPSAETQEPITSSSAVLISGEVYSFCLVCPSFLLHIDDVLICQGCDL